MAVNNIVIGPNSHRIQYDPASALADVRAAVDAAILATHGWEVHDAAAGTNAVAYRALNADGVTYKYVVVDFNSAGYVLLKTYESWNNTTHVGTNLCLNSDLTKFAQRIDLTNGGNLYIFVSPRYLAMQSYNNGVLGCLAFQCPSGCFEIERAHAEDTGAAGYPCFGWTNAGFMAHSNASKIQNNSAGCVSTWTSVTLQNNAIMPFFLPRDRWGTTNHGFNIISLGYLSNFMQPVSPTGSSVSGITVSAGAYAPGGLSTYLNTTPANITTTLLPQTPAKSTVIWNGKHFCTDIFLSTMEVSKFDPRGRLYGIKSATWGMGSFMDEFTTKQTNGFVDPAGTNTGMWLIVEGTASASRWSIPK